MKLLFRQRLFSWFDSYDIYSENEEKVYMVKGQISWGHLLRIYDANGNELGYVKEKVLTFLPQFLIYENGEEIGRIQKKWSFFSQNYFVDFCGWQVEGNFLGWDYTVQDASGTHVATVSKEIFHMTDTYILDIKNLDDALHVLMLALAIDAEKCSAAAAT